jgi:hypothetical protein
VKLSPAAMAGIGGVEGGGVCCRMLQSLVNCLGLAAHACTQLVVIPVQ